MNLIEKKNWRTYGISGWYIRDWIRENKEKMNDEEKIS